MIIVVIVLCALKMTGMLIISHEISIWMMTVVAVVAAADSYWGLASPVTDTILGVSDALTHLILLAPGYQ